MKNKIFNFFNNIYTGCSKVLEKPSSLFSLVFLLAWFFFVCTQMDDLNAIESKTNTQNQIIRTEAARIINDKDLNITLSEDLTSYKIEETKNFYYVRLNGSELNHVNLIFDKDFVLLSLKTVSNVWIVVLTFFALLYAAIFFILYIFILLILIITKTITNLKIFKNLNELENLDEIKGQDTNKS